MKSHWMMAALLSSAFVVGCGDRGTQNDQNLEQSQTGTPAPGTGGEVSPPAEPDAPAPPVSVGENSRTTIPPPRATRSDAAPPTETRPQVNGRADTNLDRPVDNRPASRPPASTPAAPRVQWRELTIPANTALPLELTTPVSTRTATVEMPVSARLRNGVIVDGVTVLPAGTVLSGQVIEVERPGRVEGRARLALRFTEARVDGERQDVRTNPITFEGEATRGEDATKIGAGAGVGAIIGGIVGGGEGAAKGAAIGGAAGTGAVLATRGREVELASGTDLAATLASAVTVRVENR